MVATKDFIEAEIYNAVPKLNEEGTAALVTCFASDGNVFSLTMTRATLEQLQDRTAREFLRVPKRARGQ